MTENEAIERIKSGICNEIGTAKYCHDNCMHGIEHCAYSMAIQALEEIQAYRSIGTVEELQKKMEELERWHIDRINENIKNPFAYTSTYICHNCDHKDEYIEELESEVAEYKSIGTIEEFKALKEDSRFLEFLYDRILPNEMERYLSMYKSSDTKTNGE